VEGCSAGRVQGPLAPYVAGFVGELVGRGYRPRSVSGQLELMAHLSRWLAEQGMEPGGLTQETAKRLSRQVSTKAGELQSGPGQTALVAAFTRARALPEPA
jgi:hypothetical protein